MVACVRKSEHRRLEEMSKFCKLVFQKYDRKNFFGVSRLDANDFSQHFEEEFKGIIVLCGTGTEIWNGAFRAGSTWLRSLNCTR